MLPKAKDIFLDALDIADPAERDAFVVRACGDDAALLSDVRSLLASHDTAPTLHPPQPALGSSIFGDGSGSGSKSGSGSFTAPAHEQPGDLVGGRYELIRKLGEGGFGVVFLARQREPVVRDVAIKLLKGGVDSAQIFARFEAERQTLARMDHPQIARVFDAGTSERGRPYFVMEYVDGQPITTYCADRTLGLVARLRLMEQVCVAVQHAHQKGVIHRDLKPGNILVAMLDGTPTPKVIDFGIAKAIGMEEDDIAAQPTMTLDAQIIGTPQYMAPEQATIGPKNIDTRSDVYSLGTVMYELIAGTPPFDPTELRRVGLEQVCRIVRERTPARPSTRLSAAVDGAPVNEPVPLWKGFDRGRLRRQVAGEIDWIVMKALEKEPARRYQSAADLGADIRRYLNHEPVMAGPPSRIYQFRKFVRRHRMEVATATLTLAALVALVIVSNVQERRARAAEAIAVAKADEAARELAKANAIADFTRQMLGGIGPSIARGRDTSLLKDLLEQATQRLGGSLAATPAIDLAVRTMIGQAQFDLGEYPRAIETLRPTYDRLRGSADKDDGERLRAGTKLGTFLVESGRADDALAILRETSDAYAKRNDHDSDDALSARVALASALLRAQKYDEALRIDEDVLKRLRASGRGETELALLVDNSVARLLYSLKRTDEAVARWEQLLIAQRKAYGDDHPGTLATMSNLAVSYGSLKRHDLAEKYGRSILELERRLYEPDHPNFVKTLTNLASTLRAAGKNDEAERHLEEAARIAQAKLSPTHAYAMAVNVQMMNLRVTQRRFDEALAYAYQNRDAFLTQFGARDGKTIAADIVVIGCLADAGRFAEAQEAIERVMPLIGGAKLTQDRLSSFHGVVADVMLGLGRIEDARREVATARELLKPTPAQESFGPPSERLQRVERALAATTTRPN